MKGILGDFIAAAAAQIAHERSWSLDDATRWADMHT